MACPPWLDARIEAADAQGLIFTPERCGPLSTDGPLSALAMAIDNQGRAPFNRWRSSRRQGSCHGLDQGEWEVPAGEHFWCDAWMCVD